MYELSASKPLDFEQTNTKLAYQYLFEAYGLEQFEEKRAINLVRNRLRLTQMGTIELINSMVLQRYIIRVTREPIPDTDPLFITVNGALKKLYEPVPKLAIYYVKLYSYVDGESTYINGAYSIRLFILRETTAREAMAILCHEAGHIKVDVIRGAPGSHIHSDIARIVSPKLYIAKEVNAWLAGMSAARVLGITREYILLARSRVMARDEDKMVKQTREKWKEFLYME
jgi:hypothetical protein